MEGSSQSVSGSAPANIKPGTIMPPNSERTTNNDETPPSSNPPLIHQLPVPFTQIPCPIKCSECERRGRLCIASGVGLHCNDCANEGISNRECVKCDVVERNLQTSAEALNGGADGDKDDDHDHDVDG